MRAAQKENLMLRMELTLRGRGKFSTLNTRWLAEFKPRDSLRLAIETTKLKASSNLK